MKRVFFLGQEEDLLLHGQEGDDPLLGQEKDLLTDVQVYLFSGRSPEFINHEPTD